MTAVWPASLPQQPLSSGYRRADPGNRIVAQPDVGPPMSRRRSTARAVPIDRVYVMDRAQFATFETFFKTTIADGALAFDLPDPIAGGTRSVKFRDQQGWEAQLEAGGKYWHVSLKLVELV